MKKPPAAVSAMPQPRTVTHQCGHAAVEISYFSPRAGAVTQVQICSQCHSSFYRKAARLVAEKAVAA